VLANTAGVKVLAPKKLSSKARGKRSMKKKGSGWGNPAKLETRLHTRPEQPWTETFRDTLVRRACGTGD
jgi:hypothetical protein